MLKKYSLLMVLLIASAFGLKAQTFQEKAPALGINFQPMDPMKMAGGAAVFDFNNDGWEDVYITGGMTQTDKLYRNNGNGTFTDVYVQAGLSKIINSATLGAAAGDLNNDGWTDLVVTTNGGYTIQIYKNNGNGTFTNMEVAGGITDTALNTSVSLGDFNLDGLLDIYVNNHVNPNADHPCSPNNFYINTGDFHFVEKGPQYGVAYDGCSLASTFTDFDNDGDLDLFSSTDFSVQTDKTMKLWKNQYPQDWLTDISQSARIDESFFGMGVSGIDYDNDGDIDYYLTNIGRSRLYRNNLAMLDTSFTDVATLAGVDNLYVPGTEVESVSWGICWGDYDNDSQFDLFVSCGFVDMNQATIQGEVPNRLFKNKGDGTFDDVSVSAGIDNPLKGRGAVSFDFDHDGDLDILQVVVWGMNQQQSFDKGTERVLFFQNTSPSKNYIRVKLEGTRSNRDGLGATVLVYAGGERRMQQVDGGGASYLSQSSMIQHFGLGDMTSVDSVVVVWPGKYDRQRIEHPGINQVLNVIQPYKTTTEAKVCYASEYMGHVCTKDTSFMMTYTASYKNADSIVTYNVHVMPENKVTMDKMVCKGSSFMGEVINEDMVITKKYPSYMGCDSMVVANVKVAMPSVNMVDSTICYGSKFRGYPYFKDTTITLQYLNQYGCDSSYIAKLNVIPAANFEESKTICFGEVFMESKHYSSELLTYNFPSQAGCDSIYRVNLTVLPAVNHKIIVELPKGGEYDGVVYETNTTFTKTFSGAAANGCDSVLTVKILIDDNSVEPDLKFVDFGLKAMPNPMSSSTIIAYNLENDADVNLKLFDFNGNEIITLQNGSMSRGSHTLTLDLNQQNIHLAQGTYVLVLTSGKTFQSHKIQLVK